MDNDYVRNDVFIEVIKRMEEMMNTNEARRNAAEARIFALIAANNAKIEVYRAESKRETDSLAADIKAVRDSVSDLKESIADLKNASSRRWTIVGSIAATLATIVAVIPFIPFLKSILGW